MTDIVHVSDGLAVMRALERVARDPRKWAGNAPRWADLGFPVIARGVHAIFPLVVAAAPENGDPGGVQRPIDVEQSLSRDLVHYYGGDFIHRESELDLDAGYGHALIAAGAVSRGGSMNWWSVQNFAAVLVRSVDPETAGETLALHIIPKDWVHYSPLNAGAKREASRHRRIMKEQAAAAAVDVSWSWTLSSQ